MSQTNLVLLAILVLGVLSRDISLIISAVILFSLRIFNLKELLPFIDQYSVKIGIILIMLGVLTPVATGELDLLQIVDTFKTPMGIVGIIMGILVTQFTRDGLNLMSSSPEVIPNLLVGLILGIAFFGGVPTGPLIASGITAFILKIIQFVK
ncbi:MAG: DUF441 domain-containing protein [Bacillota bacterium]